MKKNVLAMSLATVLIVMVALSLSSCMSTSPFASGTSAVGAPASTGQQSSAVGDILGSLLGTLIGNNVPVNEKSIVGTWAYTQPEVRFESEDFLAQAGGQVAATSIEQKLAQLYATVGIVPGTSGFIFNEDKTCTVAIGANGINGTYSVDPNTNTINIVSSTGLIKLSGKVYFGLNSLVVLFEGKKILSVAQTLAAFTGKSNSTIGTLAGALGKYNGLMLGMELSKQK